MTDEEVINAIIRKPSLVSEAIKRLSRLERNVAPSTIRASDTAIGQTERWLVEGGNNLFPELGRVPKADVYAHYLKWSAANGFKPMSQPAFGRALRVCRSDIIGKQVRVGKERHMVYEHIYLPDPRQVEDDLL